MNSVNLIKSGDSWIAGAKMRRSERLRKLLAQLRGDLTWIHGIYQHPGSEASHHLHMERKDDKYHDHDDDNNHVTTIDWNIA